MSTKTNSTTIQILSLSGVYDPTLAELTADTLTKILDNSSHKIELLHPDKVASGALRDRNCKVLVLPGGNAIAQNEFSLNNPLFQTTLQATLASQSLGIEAACASAYQIANTALLSNRLTQPPSYEAELPTTPLANGFNSFGPIGNEWNTKRPWETRHLFTVKNQQGETFNSLYAGGGFFEREFLWSGLFRGGYRTTILTTEVEGKELPVVVSQYQPFYDNKTKTQHCNKIVLRGAPHCECLSEFENPSDREANLDLLRTIYGDELRCQLQPKAN